jgi:hypothetical protein
MQGPHTHCAGTFSVAMHVLKMFWAEPLVKCAVNLGYTGYKNKSSNFISHCMAFLGLIVVLACVQGSVDAVVEGLFSVLATLSVVPIIKAPRVSLLLI